MKSFLNNFLIKSNKLELNKQEKFVSETKDSFKKACIYIHSQLGEKPFHLRGRLNFAALDSVFCAAFMAMNKEISNFRERWDILKENADYWQFCTINTSDDLTVVNRIDLAINALAE